LRSHCPISLLQQGERTAHAWHGGQVGTAQITRLWAAEITTEPGNAILDLALADGLNPAPLADAGWAVAALEVPVRVSGETVVCDVVLFNPQAGHLLAVEAKSGANLEPEQGPRLAALTRSSWSSPGASRCLSLFPALRGPVRCLADNADRICLGADEAGLRVPVLAVSGSEARLLRAGHRDGCATEAYIRPRRLPPSLTC
jgi:hypothetical protein